MSRGFGTPIRGRANPGESGKGAAALRRLSSPDPALTSVTNKLRWLSGQKHTFAIGKRYALRHLFDYGPGYRIYFAAIQKHVILLLCGSIKGTQ